MTAVVNNLEALAKMTALILTTYSQLNAVPLILTRLRAKKMCQPTLIIFFQTRHQSSFSWTNVFTLHFSTKHWKCILKEIGVKSNMKIVKIVLTSFKDENSL